MTFILSFSSARGQTLKPRQLRFLAPPRVVPKLQVGPICPTQLSGNMPCFRAHGLYSSDGSWSFQNTARHNSLRQAVCTHVSLIEVVWAFLRECFFVVDSGREKSFRAPPPKTHLCLFSHLYPSSAVMEK